MGRLNRPWRLETAPWPTSWGVKLAEKKGRFRGLYITGAMIFFASVEMDVGVGIALGIFTIIFTGLAHLIFKIVTLQKGFNAGTQTQTHPQARRTMFSSQGPRGNASYDQLIRKMQVSDLSGMSVEQAAATYASFFNRGDIASKPFFSNLYVQEVLNMGGVQVSAQTIVGSHTPTPQASTTSNAAFWSSMPESSTQATEVCANPTCSTPVTVFDFRCFSCRNRFCSACKGDKITCPSCS